MKEQNLTLTSKLKTLYIYCKDCRTEQKKKCNKHSEERQYYKLILYLPDGKVSRQLTSKKEKDAIIEAVNIKEGILSGEVQQIEKQLNCIKEKIVLKHTSKKNNSYENHSLELIETSNINAKQYPNELAGCINFYLDFLQDVDVAYHLKKNLTKDYINEVKKALHHIIEVCGRTINVNDIQDKEVGKIVKYLVQQKGYGAKTFSKKISAMTSFFIFLIKKGIIKGNPFSLVERPKVRKKPQMVTYEEFKEVIEIVRACKTKAFVNFKYVSKSGKWAGKERIEKKNLWYPWLADAFGIALYGGGRRREEIVMLKWNNVMPNKNGELIGGILRYRDLKVERAKNIHFAEEQIEIDIPITLQLAEILINLRWSEYKGTNHFIIANEEKFSRETLMDIMSKAFTYFYQKTTNPRPEISFRNLRKTYITYLRSILGVNARIITGHSSNDIIDNHYEDKSYLFKLISEQLIIS